MHNLWTLSASHGLAVSLYLTTLAWVSAGLGLACLRFTLPHLSLRLTSATALRTMAMMLAVILAGMYLAAGMLIALFPGYIDPCEPLVLAAAHFCTNGIPVYNLVVAYGPYCFLPFSLVMHLFGTDVITLRTALVAGNITLFILLYAVFRRRVTSFRAYVIVALLFGSFLLNQDYTFQIRGDLFIYLAVAAGLLSVTLTNPLVASMLMVLSISGVTGIKITAVLYLVYPLILFCRIHGTKVLIGVAGVSALVALAPFGLPTLSLRDYLKWLALMAHEPRSDKEFLGNLIITAVLFFPVILILWQFASNKSAVALSYVRSQAIPIVALALSVFATDILSAKYGAGRHHITPFGMITAYLAVDVYCVMQRSLQEKSSPSLTIVYLWGCLGALLTVAEASELLQMIATTQQERPQAIALANDVTHILNMHPNTRIELGYGNGTFNLDHHYSEVYAAPQLIYRGDAYTFDLSAEADRELMTLPFDKDNYKHLEACKADMWLIPRGEVPFSTKSIYSGMYPIAYPNHYLFPKDFKQTFTDNYVMVGSSKLFDMYICRLHKQGNAGVAFEVRLKQLANSRRY